MRDRLLDAGLQALSIVLLIGLVWGAVACGSPDSGEPTAGAGAAAETRAAAYRDDVIVAHKALIKAYESGDGDAFAALLHDGPELLIFHPMVENRFDGIEAARKGLATMTARMPEATWTEVHPMASVEGDFAWVTSHILVQSPQLKTPFVGRGTEVWTREDAGWRLIHGHWSEHAQLAGGERQP